MSNPVRNLTVSINNITPPPFNSKTPRQVPKRKRSNTSNAKRDEIVVNTKRRRITKKESEKDTKKTKNRKKETDEVEDEVEDDDFVVADDLLEDNEDEEESEEDEPNEDDLDFVVSDDLTERQELQDFMEKDYLRSLPVQERERLKKKEKELNGYKTSTVPLKYRIIESDHSVSTKTYLLWRMEQMNRLDDMSEISKIENWIETILRLPTNKYHPVTDLSPKNFLSHVEEVLNYHIWGQHTAKREVLEIMAQWIKNPNSSVPPLALVGPPGSGKTSFALAISEALQLPFNMMSLGGLTDDAVLTGHSMTYIGSQPGAFANALIKSQCMNPFIFMDEIDKIAGEEISQVLIHAIDSTQNNRFHDKYIGDVDIDLSKVFMAFSLNDPNEINHILRDRLYFIHVDGYTDEEKCKIAIDKIIPRLKEQIGYRNFNMPQRTVVHIVERYCEGDLGMRNLIRCLEKIVRHLNYCSITDKEKRKNINTVHTIEPTYAEKILLDHYRST